MDKKMGLRLEESVIVDLLEIKFTTKVQQLYS